MQKRVGLLALALLLLLSLTVIGSGQQRRPRKPANPAPAEQPTPAPQPTEPPAPPPPETIKPPENPLPVEALERLQAVIETSMGNITLEFYAKVAPNHVRQFVWLAQSGYFDGMTISRIIPKFIIQSGNPGSWGADNPNQQKRWEIPKLKAEYDASIKHERGALSLARPNGEPDGGNTHFFICALKASSLDGQYSVFGHVVNGLDIVDTIAASPIEEGTPDKPRDRIEVKHVLIKEKAVEKPVEKPTEKPADKPPEKQ